MEQIVTTTETLGLERQVRFAAPQQTVYRALTTASGISGWWMPTSGCGEHGGELWLDFPPGPGAMHVDLAQPSSRVQWTVLRCDFLPDWVGTRIRFELRPDGDSGSMLDFRHEGLTDELDCFEQCLQGWDYYLASLHDLVDTGAGRPGDRHRR
ncbi:SRPBCC domain-containing protein [Actinomycetospora endophytica]|uniref:SRPBCC domain-containing protein n=1 Tax=Actinomycetospora endophytica TaxID=2291215 RepID=A0ABS8P319_9PSEU|nr:SRPBCC domain-containing protein [Actinomycetospora endophytica]MCD2191816.1 SRPBCC domain-containing protein [Actinomycetospora endophytica]